MFGTSCWKVTTAVGTRWSAAAYGELKKTYTARLLKFVFLRQWVKLGYYDFDSRRDVFQPPGSPFVFTIDYEENILVRTCEVDYSPQMARGVTVFRARLRRLVDLVRGEEKAIYAFVFPFKEQVYWGHWSSRLPDASSYHRLRPNRIAGEALEELQVPYYDLTADMTAAGREQVLYPGLSILIGTLRATG
jgi:hypothetical protein